MLNMAIAAPVNAAADCITGTLSLSQPHQGVMIVGATVSIELGWGNLSEAGGVVCDGSRFTLSAEPGAYRASGSPADFSPAFNLSFSFADTLGYQAPVPTSLADGASDRLALLRKMSGDSVLSLATFLSTYYNRFYASETGRQSAIDLQVRYERMISAAGRSDDVKVVPVTHAWPMDSTIISFVGHSGNAAENEVVIVGGHLDSINRQNWTVNLRTGRAPGANDDGSAMGLQFALLEVLLAAAWRPPPGVTFELHAYSGEEVGLYGSLDVAASYARAGRHVRAMFMIDQAGFVSPFHTPCVAYYTDNTDVQLTQFMAKVVAPFYMPEIPLVESNEDDRADSDFHSWTMHGFRATYAAEGPIDDIVYGNAKHTPFDTPDGINVTHALGVGRLIFGAALEIVESAGPAL